LFGVSKASGYYGEKAYLASGRMELKETYEQELLSAYQQKFPNDTEISQNNLNAFKELALGTGEFPALDAAHEAYVEAFPNLQEIMLGMGEGVGGLATIIAGAIAVYSTLRYGYNKVAGN